MDDLPGLNVSHWETPLRRKTVLSGTCSGLHIGYSDMVGPGENKISIHLESLLNMPLLGIPQGDS